MRPMTITRRWHFEQLRCTLNVANYIVQANTREDLTTYRDHDDGWTVAEVIGHLLDCERLFLERAKLTVTQDCPDLPFPDQNEDVIKARYNEQDPRAVLKEWEQARSSYVAYLETVRDDDWSREGKHPKYPPFSLNDQLFLACWHDMLHLRQMTRILSAKRV